MPTTALTIGIDEVEDTFTPYADGVIERAGDMVLA